MASGGRDPSGDAVGKSPKKFASIFAYEIDPAKPLPDNILDSEKILSTLQDLGFEMLNGDDIPDERMDVDSEKSDGEEDIDQKCTYTLPKKNDNISKQYSEKVVVNQKPMDTEKVLKKYSEKIRDAKCYVVYFIVRQVGTDFKTGDDKVLQIFEFWKKFMKIDTPVVFFIQANVQMGAEIKSVLLNKDSGNKKHSDTIPRTANVLYAYLPQMVNRETSVAGILSEELRKNLDINAVLTNVIDRLNSGGCKPSPKFSSTLIQPLYLAGRFGATAEKKPMVYSRKGRYLAYAFLFGKYEREPPVLNLDFLIPNDTRSLQALADLGVELEFCVPDGKMTVTEFKGKLKAILQSEDLDSCDSIFIIVSSHGHKSLQILASDGFFSVDDIWHELSKCEKLINKPKGIFVDACRGLVEEEGVSYQVSKGVATLAIPSVGSGIEQPHMCDILIALATTEGNMAFGPGSKSVFISNLCETLNSSEDFLTILTSTMKKVALIEFHEQKGKKKQQVTFTSTLRKQFYLPENTEDQ